MSDAWSAAELDILLQYFRSECSILSICDRLYRSGFSRTERAVANKLHQLRTEGGYKKPREVTEEQLRIGFLDIETSNLAGDFGMILSWCIKVAGKDKVYRSVITKRELFEFKEDKRVVSELFDALDNFDVLITHYGGHFRFDIPYINTRALYHGFDAKIAKLKGRKYVRDTYPIAKKYLKLSSNRLERIQELLGIDEGKDADAKTKLKPKVWNLARFGHKKSLQYVDEHCEADVRVLEKTYNRLKVLAKPTYVPW